MTGQFTSKVALVTGAGSGIGRAAAMAFAREGARVVVADVHEAGGAETVDLIHGLEEGGEALFIRTDVAQTAEVAALVQRAVAMYGRLDYACNNAGIAGGGLPIHTYPEEDWHRIISVNLTGVWLCMKYELAQMVQQGGGAIVNMASATGLVGVAGASAYVASKHGVVGLTKGAALEYAQLGIRVNAVCPAAVHTPIWEPLLAGNPEAAAVVWLCSDAASFVTGQALAVDAGTWCSNWGSGAGRKVQGANPRSP